MSEESKETRNDIPDSIKVHILEREKAAIQKMLEKEASLVERITKEAEKAKNQAIKYVGGFALLLGIFSTLGIIKLIKLQTKEVLNNAIEGTLLEDLEGITAEVKLYKEGSETAFKKAEENSKLIEKLLNDARNSEWISPASLQSGWRNYENDHVGFGYIKTALGEVKLRGLITRGKLNSTVFILPEKYRPQKKRSA